MGMGSESAEPYWVAVQVEDGWPASEEPLLQAARATLLHQEAPPVEVAVVVSGDETLRELNHRYRGIDATTDVLAFSNESRGPFVGVGGSPRYLGDVILSYPRAQAQAGEAGHSVEAELQLLVVHGLLHLLGYDDQDEPERTRMWAAQAAIVGTLGIEVNLPE